MNYQWNLWIWEGRAWRVLAAYESKDDAYASLAANDTEDTPCTVSMIGTPKDQYMWDNCTVRRAPQNYLRLAPPPPPPPPPEKVVDNRCRGSFGT